MRSDKDEFHARFRTVDENGARNYCFAWRSCARSRRESCRVSGRRIRGHKKRKNTPLRIFASVASRFCSIKDASTSLRAVLRMAHPMISRSSSVRCISIAMLFVVRSHDLVLDSSPIAVVESPLITSC